MSETSVIRVKRLEATTLNMSIHEILLSERTKQELIDRHPGLEQRPAIFGFFLPPWQRSLVWTETQNQKFIESAWEGFHLGLYAVTPYKYTKARDQNRVLRTELHPLSNLLIDGQQRINAIRTYVNDAFEVYGYKYSELPEIDKRQFKLTPFARASLDIYDEQKLRELYNKYNFGGTPHQSSERA